MNPAKAKRGRPLKDDDFLAMGSMQENCKGKEAGSGAVIGRTLALEPQEGAH